MKDLDSIYFAARELPPEDRPAYLTRVCEGNQVLRARVEQMLAVSDKAEAFITDLPDDAEEERKPGRESVKTLKLDPADSVDEAIGQKIGRYKILERVGEGGCGVVYVAEQTEPVRRRVALKVIKLGMDTKQVVARFEAERQALAMMDHPNIAKVLDGGATDNGRPYFIMELVRGIKITDYCDQASLPTKERLGLFIQVCHAIQHAHQKGIIHRDIKPSNILVTLNDGVPVPKVIDFGIAKATEGRLTEATVYTQLHQFIGTPAYMSPEQAEMSSLDIDTRSDIYSLGVLLYELLAGKTPFDAQELMSLGIDAMRKAIREKEPVRPSTRLATLQGDELTTAAKRRAVEAPRLIHQLKGDLDWIVMKCLEKDRTRRYETANGLATDLKRHLKNEPVLARPPSTLYEFQKTFRRNKVGFAAATAIILALSAGVVMSAWQAVRARQAEQQAKERLAEVGKEKDAKELATQDAEAVSKFLTEVFQSPDPTRDGRTIAVAEVLDKAAKNLQSDAAVPPGRRVKLQATLGGTYQALGLYREAIALGEKVRDYDLATFGLENTNTLHAMGNLAVSYTRAGRWDEALKLGEQVLTVDRKVLGPEHPQTLGAMANLAGSYDNVGRKNEALKLREETLALSRKVLGSEHSDTVGAMNDLAISYGNAGRGGEALKLQEEVLTLDRKVLGPEHPDTLIAMGNLAVSYNATGRKDEALKLSEETLALSRKVLGPEHPDTLRAMINLTVSYDAASRRDETLKLREETLALSRKVLGAEDPLTLKAINDLAISYDNAGRKHEALKLREEFWKAYDGQAWVKALRGAGIAIRNLEHLPDGTWEVDLSNTKFSDLTLLKGVPISSLTLNHTEVSDLSPLRGMALKTLMLNDTLVGDLSPLQGMRLELLEIMNTKIADLSVLRGMPIHALQLGGSAVANLEPLHGMPLKSLWMFNTGIADLGPLAGMGLDQLHLSGTKVKDLSVVRGMPLTRLRLHYCSEIADVSPLADCAGLRDATLPPNATNVECLRALRGVQRLSFTEDQSSYEPDKTATEFWTDYELESRTKAVTPDGASGGDSLTAWLNAFGQLVAASPADTLKGMHLATVYLWLGQTNEHLALCRKLLEHAAHSQEPGVHDQAAKAYLIQPHPDPELLKLEVSSGRRALALSTTNNPYRPWFLITAGLADVRDAKPDEAEPLLTEALKDSSDNPEQHGLGLACRAIARVQLGRTNEARADFAELEKLALPLPPHGSFSAALTNVDHLVVCIAYEEARALLNGLRTPHP